MSTTSLDWTGERFLPALGGDIALEHLHRYAFARSLSRGMRVLDIACGEGYGSAMLAEHALSVIGIDLDAGAVQHARNNHIRPNLNFHQGSCTCLDLPEASIDLAVSFETLEHHDEHEAMLTELRRVLSPDGILIISTPDRLHYSDATGYTNPYHVHELYAEEFFQLMHRHFPHTLFFGQRIAYGSLIAPFEESEAFLSFSNTGGEIASQRGVTAPLYLLSIASAMPLPPMPASLLDGTSDHNLEIYKLREELQVAKDLLGAVHDSLYWRMAKPVRWARRMLRKMQGKFCA